MAFSNNQADISFLVTALTPSGSPVDTLLIRLEVKPEIKTENQPESSKSKPRRAHRITRHKADFKNDLTTEFHEKGELKEKYKHIFSKYESLVGELFNNELAYIFSSRRVLSRDEQATTICQEQQTLSRWALSTNSGIARSSSFIGNT